MKNIELQTKEKSIFPEYKQYQLEINGKSFTKREIDVISCILNGRSVKKIAILLSISDKTVESHIRNVTLKLGQSTQESIIDFIEKSDKYALFKQHYIHLLIQASFKLELKNIQSLTQNIKKLRLILDSEAQTDYGWFASKVAEDMRLAGMRVLQSQEKVSLDSTDDHKLYFVFNEINNYDHFKLKTDKQETLSVICLNQKIAESIEEKMPGVVCHILSEGENYYFLIFELLLKIYPNLKIANNFAKFKTQYSILIEGSSVPAIKENNTKILITDQNVQVNKLPFFSKQNYKIPVVVSAIVGFSFLVILFFYQQQVQKANATTSNKNLAALENFDLLERFKSGKNVAWNLPRQDQKFIGRKQILHELHDKLHSKDNNHAISAVSVCAGLGGIGKTQLALQYSHSATYNYKLKAWFLAENIDQLKQQYIEFSFSLGYKDREPSFEKSLHYIKNWLAKNPGWLLVYDNVESYEQIKDFLPQHGGWVIITTRQQNWPNVFEKLDINVMPESEAIDLIQSLIQNNKIVNKESDLKELVKTLGYLPLALAQAGAYMRQNLVTVEQYLKLYKEHITQLIEDDSLPEGTSHKPIATTWNISLQEILKDAKLKNQPPLAFELLSACAYLAPEKISQNVLLTWLKEVHPELPNPEWVLPKLIGQLRQYSMLSLDPDGGIVIHRLVQAVLRYQNELAINKKNNPNYLTQNWFNGLLKATHKQFIKKTQILDDEKRQRDLLPHLQIMLNHYKEIWPNASELKLVPILNDVGIVFSQASDFRSARTYHERALKILRQNYNSTHIDIAITQDYLGNTYRNLGLEREAKDLHSQALNIMQKHYGKDHIEIADVLDHLGRASRMLGDFNQAKDLHERAFKIKENYYGKDHIQVGLILDQLGRDYKNLLNIEQAKIILERSLQIKEKYYGGNHVEVAITLDYLGRCFRYLGDIKHAKALHERSVKIKEAYYGPDHIVVAYTLDQLGREVRYLGQLEQARDLHIRSARIKEAHYGKDHVEVAYTLDYLGRVYRAMGDLEKAKELHLKNFEIKQKYYGKDSLSMAYAADQLARDYRELSEVEKAKELHSYAFKLMEKAYPNDSMTIALISDQLGKDLRLIGDLQQAKQLHEKALKIKTQRYGNNHPETANSYSNLGAVLVSMGECEEGKLYLDRALKIKRQYYGKNNIHLVETLVELAKTYESCGNIKRSRLYLKQVALNKKFIPKR